MQRNRYVFEPCRGHALTALGLVLTLILVTGCAWSVGGEGRKTIAVPTLGEELRELKRAADEGVLSPEEYEEARQRLLRSADERRAHR